MLTYEEVDHRVEASRQRRGEDAEARVERHEDRYVRERDHHHEKSNGLDDLELAITIQAITIQATTAWAITI